MYRGRGKKWRERMYKRTRIDGSCTGDAMMGEGAKLKARRTVLSSSFALLPLSSSSFPPPLSSSSPSLSFFASPSLFSPLQLREQLLGVESLKADLVDLGEEGVCEGGYRVQGRCERRYRKRRWMERRREGEKETGTRSAPNSDILEEAGRATYILRDVHVRGGIQRSLAQ
jgi:hypothetical protein